MLKNHFAGSPCFSKINKKILISCLPFHHSIIIQVGGTIWMKHTEKICSNNLHSVYLTLIKMEASKKDAEDVIQETAVFIHIL